MTTHADREQAIYEALRPFRMAVSTLSRPIHSAFDELAAMDGVLLGMLWQPQIMNFSPFDTLPICPARGESILEGSQEKTASRAKTSSIARDHEYRKSAHSDIASNGQISSTYRPNDAQDAPPVFSFRQREPSGANRPVSSSYVHNSLSEGSLVNGLRHMARETEHRTLKSSVQDAVGSRADRLNVSSELDSDRHEIRQKPFNAVSGGALELINSLADGLLSPNREAADGRHQSDSKSSARKALQSANVVTGTAERGLRPIETGNDSTRQLEAMADELLLLGKPDALRSTHDEHSIAPLGEVINRGSLREHQSDGALIEHSVNPANPALDVDALIVDEQNSMWPPKELIAYVETVAHLVNEAIIEQARRRGVDLR